MSQSCLACLFESVLASDAVEPDGIVAQSAEAGAEGTGTRYAHYEIATAEDGSPVELGRGAMGVTYRAVDTTLRSTVALKVINGRLAAHPRARERFLREAQAAAGLRHPHVASVFFFGERPGEGNHSTPWNSSRAKPSWRACGGQAGCRWMRSWKSARRWPTRWPRPRRAA